MTEKHQRAPITRVVLRKGDPSLQRQGYSKQQAMTNWVAVAYDSNGNMRSSVNSPDLEYVKKKIAEFWPDVPIEHK